MSQVERTSTEEGMANAEEQRVLYAAIDSF